MSIYVPQYKHDIFVSYAHIDNQALIGANKGWVTTLINSLKIKLGQKLGKADAFSLWMDYEVQGNTVLTAETLEHLESSATFVLILSPGYIESQWCQLELNTFLAKVGENSGCVFVVEHNDVEEQPYSLNDLLGYKFWLRDDTGRSRTLGIPQPHPEEREYYQRLDDLAHQMADKLKVLKKESKTEPVTIPDSLEATTPTTTIFMAEVTADLEERRNEVKRYLDQQGVRVLPDKKYSFTTIQQEIEQDLSQCRLFVQLLSEKTDTFNYSQFQYEHAGVANLPILQWRDPALESQKIEGSAHSALLQGSTVIATELADFQELIFKRLQPKKEKPLIVDDMEGAWVFINVAREDKVFADEIRKSLEAESIEYSLPLEISADTSPTEIREDLEQNLLACDAVIVPYDKTPVTKIRQYLIHCRRMQPKREQPLKVIGIFNKPLPNKSPINMGLCHVQILECPTLPVDSCLPQFIRLLRT